MVYENRMDVHLESLAVRGCLGPYPGCWGDVYLELVPVLAELGLARNCGRLLALFPDGVLELVVVVAGAVVLVGRLDVEGVVVGMVVA